MDRTRDAGLILVTGASGQIGTEVCRRLPATNHDILAIDLNSDPAQSVKACDLRRASEVVRLFSEHPIRGVVHLAGILPGAFRSDPLAGAEVNLQGSTELLRQAAQAGVKRFVLPVR